ncbi:MAG: tRNA lysidine(34) synthetase TilS [Paracoccaceae bacterium]|nr:tRNA lysidine(34) synthetase TilS [Paracoccaceae bacterium]
MTETSLDQRYADAMGQLLGPDFPTDIALAVSGGGDSMAMLTLAHNWAHRWGVKLWVVTIDHGLRLESADEAALVAEEARALGHPHATLTWDWVGQGNKMDAARRARLDLIDQWRGGIQHILMAHTRDDVAETFLMRLQRGSGVEGLSAMAAQRSVFTEGTAKGDITGDQPPDAGRTDGFTLIRPCLGMRRDELRHYLRTLKGRWVEDPTNEDTRYVRAEIRQAFASFEELGFDTDMLAATAARLAEARDALRARAAQVWQEIGQEGHSHGAPTGELLFDRTGFQSIERDTQRRLLSHALQFIACTDYRPRGAPLSALLDRLLSGGGGTLHGCEARMERDRLRIFRELQAVGPDIDRLDGNALWDGRWWVSDLGLNAQNGSNLRVRPLNEDGWQQATGDQPVDAPPHASARSLPSIWEGETLIACDALCIGPGGTTQLRPFGRPQRSFTAFLLSH